MSDALATEGFQILPNVFSLAECVDIREALTNSTRHTDATMLQRERAGARHLMQHPIVRRCAYDQRMLGLAQACLGETAIPYRATLFAKTAKANWLVVWHQDTALPLTRTNESPEWQHWSCKAGIVYAHAPAWALQQIVALRLHLDDVTDANGPLRVIPGSHKFGVLDDEAVFALARQNEPVECLGQAGGVMLMSPLLLHASSKIQCDLPRRVLHLEYASSLQLTANLQLQIA